jgi:hypothetical protein
VPSEQWLSLSGRICVGRRGTTIGTRIRPKKDSVHQRRGNELDIGGKVPVSFLYPLD